MKAKLEIYGETGDVLKTVDLPAWFTWADDDGIVLLVALTDVKLDGVNGVQLLIDPKEILEEMKRAFP